MSLSKDETKLISMELEIDEGPPSSLVCTSCGQVFDPKIEGNKNICSECVDDIRADEIASYLGFD